MEDQTFHRRDDAPLSANERGLADIAGTPGGAAHLGPAISAGGDVFQCNCLLTNQGIDHFLLVELQFPHEHGADEVLQAAHRTGAAQWKIWKTKSIERHPLSHLLGL